MEQIEFRYVLTDGENESKEVRTFKKGEDGLLDHEVCEMFLDFMNSVGFSEDNVFRFFNPFN